MYQGDIDYNIVSFCTGLSPRKIEKGIRNYIIGGVFSSFLARWKEEIICF